MGNGKGEGMRFELCAAAKGNAVRRTRLATHSPWEGSCQFLATPRGTLRFGTQFVQLATNSPATTPHISIITIQMSREREQREWNRNGRGRQASPQALEWYLAGAAVIERVWPRRSLCQ